MPISGDFSSVADLSVVPYALIELIFTDSFATG
jgi:hypothetical protein